MGGKDGTQYYQFSMYMGGVTTVCSILSIIVYVGVWGLAITDSSTDFLALIGGVLGLLAGKQQVRHSTLTHVLRTHRKDAARRGFATAGFAAGFWIVCDANYARFSAWPCNLLLTLRTRRVCPPQNKLLLTIAMVIYILVTIWFVFAFMGYSLLNAACNAECVETDATCTVLTAGGDSTNCDAVTDLTTADECNAIAECNYNFAQTCEPKTQEEIDFCDHVAGIYFLTFVVLVSAFAGSVMGCCVVCCGNDEVDGGDDSG